MVIGLQIDWIALVRRIPVEGWGRPLTSASTVGIWRMIGDAGAFTGPTLISSIAATIGLGPSLGISAVLGFIGLFVMARFVPETRIQSSAPSD